MRLYLAMLWGLAIAPCMAGPDCITNEHATARDVSIENPIDESPKLAEMLRDKSEAANRDKRGTLVLEKMSQDQNWLEFTGIHAPSENGSQKAGLCESGSPSRLNAGEAKFGAVAAHSNEHARRQLGLKRR